VFVRPNFGQRAGEVQFMRPDIARELIASGRATDPRLEELDSLIQLGGEVTPAPALVGERAPEAILPAAVVRELTSHVSRRSRR
jgi:hypothetical protein